MTVKDLIKLLEQENPDRLVICQKDAEGNGYSPLCGVSQGGYLADSTWSGDVKLEFLTENFKLLGFSEEDVADESYIPALILYPIN